MRRRELERIFIDNIMRPIYLFVIFILCSCNDSLEEIESGVISQRLKEDSTSLSSGMTKELKEYLDHFHPLNELDLKDTLFPVFKVTPRTVGLVIAMNDMV